MTTPAFSRASLSPVGTRQPSSSSMAPGGSSTTAGSSGGGGSGGRRQTSPVVQKALGIKLSLAEQNPRQDFSTSLKVFRAAHEAADRLNILQSQSLRLLERSASLLLSVKKKFETAGPGAAAAAPPPSPNAPGSKTNKDPTHVFRLQGVLFDVQMFMTSLDGEKDRMALLVLNLGKTQLSLEDLRAKVKGAVEFYEVEDLVDISHWEEQDGTDLVEDLDALPRLFRLSINMRGPTFDEYQAALQAEASAPASPMDGASPLPSPALSTNSSLQSGPPSKRREAFVNWCLERQPVLKQGSEAKIVMPPPGSTTSPLGGLRRPGGGSNTLPVKRAASAMVGSGRPSASSAFLNREKGGDLTEEPGSESNSRAGSPTPGSAVNRSFSTSLSNMTTGEDESVKEPPKPSVNVAAEAAKKAMEMKESRLKPKPKAAPASPPEPIKVVSQEPKAIAVGEPEPSPKKIEKEEEFKTAQAEMKSEDDGPSTPSQSSAAATESEGTPKASRKETQLKEVPKPEPSPAPVASRGLSPPKDEPKPVPAPEPPAPPAKEKSPEPPVVPVKAEQEPSSDFQKPASSPAMPKITISDGQNKHGANLSITSTKEANVPKLATPPGSNSPGIAAAMGITLESPVKLELDSGEMTPTTVKAPEPPAKESSPPPPSRPSLQTLSFRQSTSPFAAYTAPPSDVPRSATEPMLNNNIVTPTSPNPASLPGVRVLALDGGGTRGLFTLYILKGLMERIRFQLNLPMTPKPCDYFDLICGSSTGGLIAILLGRLHMDVNEATETYLNMARGVFGREKGALSAFLGKTKFSARNLEAAMQNAVGKVTKDSLSAMKEDDSDDVSSIPSVSASGGLAGDSRCKTFVLGQNAANGAANPIRSYEPTEPSYSRTRRRTMDEVQIWQAARATSAAPSFFKPITLENGERTFGGNNSSGMPEEFNNPSETAMDEIKTAFGPQRDIGVFISIGTGRLPASNGATPRKASGGGRGKGQIIKAVTRISQACESVATRMETRFRREGRMHTYFRFNPIDVDWNETTGGPEEWSSGTMRSTEAKAKDYLRNEKAAEYERCVGALAKLKQDQPATRPPSTLDLSLNGSNSDFIPAMPGFSNSPATPNPPSRFSSLPTKTGGTSAGVKSSTISGAKPPATSTTKTDANQAAQPPLLRPSISLENLALPDFYLHSFSSTGSFNASEEHTT